MLVGIDLDRLNHYTNEIAEEIKNIKEKMRGRGIYPAESAMAVAQLEDIESKLRRIGSSTTNPLPSDE